MGSITKNKSLLQEIFNLADKDKDGKLTIVSNIN